MSDRRNYRSRRSRSRSRSPPIRGRGRGGSPQGPFVSSSKHTNSDDPDLLKSRVFIGNLPSDKVDQTEISMMFEKYGKILAVSILRGFGFVQFLNETDAREAVRMESGGLLKGSKLDIKMAAEGRKRIGDRHPPLDGPRRSPGRDRERDRERMNRDRGGRDGRDGRDQRDRSSRGREDPYDEDPYRRGGRESAGRDPYDRHERRPPPPHPAEAYDDPYRRAPPARDPRDTYYDRFPADPYRRDPYPLQPPAGVDPYARDPYPRADPYVPPVAEPRLDVPPYECQIFMLTAGIRPYAEALERRLAVHKMVCDIRLLPEELPPSKAMEELSRRRIPYAITITAQNEVHRSITLNILHGTPQEHRNMPLEDALGLMGRKFEEYVKEIREKATVGGSSAAALGTAAVTVGSGSQEFMPPDSETHYLLNLLADNRFLTLDELDTVLKYLTERRRRLVEGKRGGTEEKAINDQQAELQNKILDILNGDQQPGGVLAARQMAGVAATAAHKPHPPQQPPQGYPSRAPGSTSINFDNPSVQKALDNLIQSGPNLLKNINAMSVSPQQHATGAPLGGHFRGASGVSATPPMSQYAAPAQQSYGGW